MFKFKDVSPFSKKLSDHIHHHTMFYIGLLLFLALTFIFWSMSLYHHDIPRISKTADPITTKISYAEPTPIKLDGSVEGTSDTVDISTLSDEWIGSVNMVSGVEQTFSGRFFIHITRDGDKKIYTCNSDSYDMAKADRLKLVERLAKFNKSFQENQ